MQFPRKFLRTEYGTLHWTPLRLLHQSLHFSALNSVTDQAIGEEAGKQLCVLSLKYWSKYLPDKWKY
jgi:hypothetical protein